MPAPLTHWHIKNPLEGRQTTERCAKRRGNVPHLILTSANRKDPTVHTHAFDPYIRTLGLTWRVRFAVTPQARTCQIISHPTTRVHEVLLTANAVEKPALFLPDVVHELCHAALAERTSMAFSTMFFCRRYNALTGASAQMFAAAAHHAYLAWAHVDLWVNRLRHTHWPALTRNDHASFAASVKKLARASDWPRAQRDPMAILGMAMCVAETTRFGVRGFSIQPTIDRLTEPARHTVVTLAEYYTTLPELSGDRASDLQVLERSVQEVARATQLPFVPRLVEEDGIDLWDIGDF